MATALCLTLGHNASAIMVCDGTIVAGYEEERLSGLKSDSHFPRSAISRLLTDHPVNKADLHICISHWYLDGKLAPHDFKHLDLSMLESISYPHHWHAVNLDFTHHDAHYEIAKVFAGEDFSKKAIGIVMDGFGTSAETLSVYKSGKVLYRSFGFQSSFGLLYQYTTSYLGFKENQDEYKLLGYEAEYTPNILMTELVSKYTEIYVKNNISHKISEDDPLVNMSALSYTRAMIYTMLDDVVDQVGCTRADDIIKAISYFVQALLERAVIEIIHIFGAKKLLLSGGVFMNVKLNKALVDEFDEVCILPICGDQGAGLGVYNHVFKDLQWPGHLFWGLRDLNPDGGIAGASSVSRDAALEAICHELSKSGVVQVIQGAMEFGARSLCNTCTLAMPTKDNVKMINEINGRNTIMPMAPVVLPETLDYLHNHDKVHKSLEYMVCALSIHDSTPRSNLDGASHKYARNGEVTCRPQVVQEGLIYDVLQVTGPLINTSLNAHGQPIVFEKGSIETCLAIQGYRIKTFIIIEGDTA